MIWMLRLQRVTRRGSSRLRWPDGTIEAATQRSLRSVRPQVCQASWTHQAVVAPATTFGRLHESMIAKIEDVSRVPASRIHR